MEKSTPVNKFPHAMLEEIYEQPTANRRTLDLYLDDQGLRAGAFAPLEQWLNRHGIDVNRPHNRSKTAIEA